MPWSKFIPEHFIENFKDIKNNQYIAVLGYVCSPIFQDLPQ